MTGWAARHPVLTVVLALLVAGWLAGQGDTGDEAAPDRPAASSTPDSDDEPTDPADPTDSTPPAPETSEPEPPLSVSPPARFYRVVEVIDGDTIDLANGERVRLVGIDTPEVGECGYEAAKQRLERLALGQRVTLRESDEDRDRYGRLLRYVDRGRRDLGLDLIQQGLAVARYDSRDGYGRHPREDRYIRADAAAPDRGCAQPRTLMQQPGAGCEPGYEPCVPSYPPDVDCSDVDGPVRVQGDDPHGLDRDGDGTGCDSGA